MNTLCHSCQTQYPDMCDDCVMALDPELNYALCDEEDFGKEFNFGEKLINISSGEDCYA